jgi:hypothetical protein
MKQILIILFIAAGINSYAQEIRLKSSKCNFGFVREGDTVKLRYELKNVGKEPLVISDYEVECGCTVLQKPSAPILPGETYILSATFDTHEKYDRQDRTIKVVTNAVNSPTVLRFKGVVLKRK